jgi:hypothetical protein
MMQQRSVDSRPTARQADAGFTSSECGILEEFSNSGVLFTIGIKAEAGRSRSDVITQSRPWTGMNRGDCIWVQTCADAT